MVVGAFCAFLLGAKGQRVAVGCMCGWFALVLGRFICHVANMDSLMLEGCVVFLLMLIFVITGVIHFNLTIILSTALVGSYFFVRGVGIYAGGFPNEYVLAHKMRDYKEIDFNEPAAWVYLGLIVLGTCAASYAQFRIFRKQEDIMIFPYARIN